MSITIKDILDLDVFKSHRLFTGENGLGNEVKTVGIIDHETEDMILKTYQPNEFVISTFFIIKDHPEKLFNYVEKLIEVDVSGLGIKDIYFNNIPDNVINLAQKNNFPIFIFREVYYESLIMSIVNAIKDKESVEARVEKIDKIISDRHNKQTILKLAYNINKNFKDKHIVLYCKSSSNTPWEFNKMFVPFQRFSSIIPYRLGYLIIFTFESIRNEDIKQVVLNRVKDIGIPTSNFVIGISNLYTDLSDLDLSINESLFCYEHGLSSTSKIVFYDDLGVNKLLIPLINNKWAKRYYTNIIKPLVEYDKKSDTSLIETARVYVKNNGDIKATASELYQHSNTIRYRIDKIKKILNEYSNVKNFYEELSLTIRLYNLYNRE